MSARRRTVTITDVAGRAGVSPATVSRVMNDRFSGDPEVGERVRAAARDLAYEPSPLARSLALGRTHAIAFVVPDLANPAFQSVLAGLSKTAASDGYRVLVADSGESPADEAPLAVEIRRRTDAIVLCAPRMPDEELTALAEQLGPLVVINRPDARIEAPSLSIDYRTGIRALAEHLYALGHRSLAYVYGPERSASNANRRRGLADFARDHPDVRLELVAAGAGTDEGWRAAPEVRRTGVTAALAYNDLVAAGLLGGLREQGVSVPGDISVTGFDDIPLARYLAPALTTASVPHAELGIAAWQRMRSLVRGEPVGHDVVFQPRLELRDSSAAPARTVG